MAVARKADALIEAGGEGGERRRLHRVPLEGFITVYSFYAALAGYNGKKWHSLTTKAAEDEVLSLREMTGETVMHWAVQSESTAKLLEVIAARDAGLVHVKDKYGCTPLHLAAKCGREAVIQALLAAGADTNAKDAGGHTPLVYSRNGCSAAVVALLS